MALLGASLALSSMTGCSWIFTQPLRDDQPQWQEPSCSTTPGPPTLDTILFLTNAGTTGYVATQNVSDKSLRLAAGFSVAAIWLASAVYGFVEITQCRIAQSEPPPVQLHPIGTGPVFYQGRPVGVPEPMPSPGRRVDAPSVQAPPRPPGDVQARPDASADGG
jgi:hypothetical protein